MSVEHEDLARDTNAAADVKYTDGAVTVAKLRALLADYPDDAIVVLSEDAEGNGFSPLADLGNAWYAPAQAWCGEVYNIGPDSEGEVYEPERGRDLFAVVLSPVN